MKLQGFWEDPTHQVAPISHAPLRSPTEWPVGSIESAFWGGSYWPETPKNQIYIYIYGCLVEESCPKTTNQDFISWYFMNNQEKNWHLVMSNHFPCEDLESSNWKNQLKMDVSDSEKWSDCPMMERKLFNLYGECVYMCHIYIHKNDICICNIYIFVSFCQLKRAAKAWLKSGYQIPLNFYL